MADKTCRVAREAISLFSLILFISSIAHAKIIYIDDDANGLNDGSSWNDAYKYLQNALSVAQYGDLIRVAQGVYKPDRFSEPLPGQASNPYPFDGATSVSVNRDLMWAAGAHATSHDVYFGTSNPPPFIRNQTDTRFYPGIMAYETTYYWRIDELNASGIATGDVWSFTTREDTCQVLV